jgi:hypothetical protein
MEESSIEILARRPCAVLGGDFMQMVISITVSKSTAENVVVATQFGPNPAIELDYVPARVWRSQSRGLARGLHDDCIEKASEDYSTEVLVSPILTVIGEHGFEP